MYKNILVINTMHIGDLMLVTPALRTLRTNYPGAHRALDGQAARRPRALPTRTSTSASSSTSTARTRASSPSCASSGKSARATSTSSSTSTAMNALRPSPPGGKRIVGYSQPASSASLTRSCRTAPWPTRHPNSSSIQVLCHLDVLKESPSVSRPSTTAASR